MSARGLSRLAVAMRRLIAAGSLAAACIFLGAACGGGTLTTATPETVVGKISQTLPKGDAAAGKKLFLGSAGCGGCHTYAPAGSTGKVGPDLDHLAADAKKANHGTIQDYVHESILSPNSYVVPGYPSPSTMPSYSGQLNEQQVADLVAFLTQGAK
jgi:mono/diheme cytochrome c family protein